MSYWVSELSKKAVRACTMNREAIGNHRQDMTRPILEELLNNGYTLVTWNSNNSMHSKCQDLDKQVWDLADFLRTTEYDAPLFCRSHPGDSSCTLLVSGDNLPIVSVDSYGNVQEGI